MSQAVAGFQLQTPWKLFTGLWNKATARWFTSLGVTSGGTTEALRLRMKITLEDALSLPGKYAEKQTPVLAAFVTRSVSVVRVTGTIRVSIVGGVSHLFIGKEDHASDQIEFWLSDCTFEYGDFRDENRHEQV